MKSFVSAVVVFLLILAGDLQARPGGGGPRGGGRVTPSVRAGNLPVTANTRNPDRTNLDRSNERKEARQSGELPKPSTQPLQSRQQLANRSADAAPQNVEHTQAFTPAWYAQHPQAWQFTHPHADAWVATSFATAAAWLGWNAVTTTSGTTTYSSDSDTVVADQGDAPLPPAGAGLPAGASNDWLPLGVYTLVRPGQSQGTSLLQLAVNKEGAVRGTYYDEISDSSHILQGTVNNQSQMLDWTVGETGKVVFQAGLDDLTQQSTPVALRFPSGRVTYGTLLKQTAPASN